jgi:hypothetical protein
MESNKKNNSKIIDSKLKTAFTIVEVSILFVIFLIVAFLVAPLSLDDTMQAKNVSNWKRVQGDFANIFYTINSQKDTENFDFNNTFENTIKPEVKTDIIPYKITYMNGAYPNTDYRFSTFKQTNKKATVAYKFYDQPQDGILGLLMYDVNGQVGPNVWGKDVFGFNIYEDKFEPFCKDKQNSIQDKDCSRTGTGLCCSNWYLIGGKLN